jgi:hypothetical protein
MSTQPKLAAFDLDGTLLRGVTVCGALTRPLGRLDQMQEFEQLSLPDASESPRDGCPCPSSLTPPGAAAIIGPVGAQPLGGLLWQHMD